MAPADGPLPLVGRDHDVTALREMLTAAAGGVGGTACLVGPAGIGKTRLAAEAVRIARDQGFRCAWGAGWTEGGAPPLWPWQGILEQLGIATLDEPATSSDQERFATFRAVADALVAMARHQPVLIVVDDAHTIDVGALLLTRFLARALRASEVQIVMTMRPTVVPDDARAAVIDEIEREATQLHVGPLSIDSVGDLIRTVEGGALAVSVDELHRLTGGNPWLVGELIAAGSTDRGSTRSGTSVAAIVNMRLESLPTDAHPVLACIGLLGPRARVPNITAASAATSCSGDADAVGRLLDIASDAGVISIDEGTCRFTHGLLAEAVSSKLDDDERASLHDRIADVFEQIARSSTDADAVVATAHHRLAAVMIRKDRAAVIEVVAACRQAADSLRAGLAHESASSMLAEAVDLHEAVGLDVPAALLLDVARTELVAGNLLAARRWFRRAADRADVPIELATAAVGLGGIWVHEHRSATDNAAFLALLERAVVALGDDRADLAVRMRVRLACERVYVGVGSADDVSDACRAARDNGNRVALAEALSLRHHTMLGPANTGPARLQIADELVHVAAAAGDGVLGLMGVLWRAIDLLLMGDERAERALAEARERADALQVAAVLFVIDAIDVMRLMRRGCIDEAEAAAHRCVRLGTAIGDADAIGYFGGHLLTIRWLQLRPHDILGLARQVADSPTLVDGDVAPRAAAAVLAAMIGELDQARADLHHVMQRVPRNAAVSSNWMISMFCAAETASMLGDRKTAEMVYALLLPYRHLPIMGSVGVVCLGSAERSLGVSAAAAGEQHLAVHHFEQAVEHNHRLGNRVMVAISQGDLGCALIGRAEPGDATRGAERVESAAAELHRMGLHERAAALCAAADRQRRAVPVPDGEVAVFAGRCRFSYGDHTVDLPDNVGVQRLCRLLRQPSADLAAVDLAGATTTVMSLHHEVHDVATLRSYRARLDELRGDIDDADAAHDIELSARLRTQLDDVLVLLRPTLGLGGRSRSFIDDAERARVAVRKSLGRVFDAVRAQDSEFADELERSIHTGVHCRFEPAAAFPAVWRFVRVDDVISMTSAG